MGILSKSPSISHEKGNSAAQKTSVGSGSRPTASKVKIETSAPKEPQGLSRKPSGSLK